jgi:DNA-binding NtrC family response regulator
MDAIKYMGRIEAEPHILLVDDDPIFGQLLQRVALKEGVRLTVISSAEDAYRWVPALKFDVGLIDYDLGRVTGIQLCNFMQAEGHEVPILLISHTGVVEESLWPTSVKRALSKDAGPYSILAVARRLHSLNLGKDG